jgi:hypothetical protein
MTDSPNTPLHTSWMARRQEAFETGMEALRRMSACKTPVEMAVIYGEWLSGSMTRILADLEEGQKASLALFASTPRAEPAASAEPAAPPQLREAA